MKLKNSSNLEKSDIVELVKKQNSWRSRCINLIASENVMSDLAEQVYLSDFMHRYAEGEPFDRYYNGTRYIDELEIIAQNLMKDLLSVDWIDVRPISGTIANYVVFTSLLKPGDKIVSLSTPCGGHISHNKYGAPTALGLVVENYPFNNEEMNIDIDKTRRMVEEMKEKPKLFVLGASLFLFPHPVKEIKELASEYGGKVMYDAAHVLGLIVGGEFQDPFSEGADVLTSSTHKTFPGPQGGLVATRDGELFKRIKKHTFPMFTSNHHLHRIPSLAITSLEMKEKGKDYARQTVRNARALAQSLYELGLPVIAETLGFTKSHQIALDMSRIGLDGKTAADLAERANIILNKNLLPWEPLKNVKTPTGIRIGVQEMTRFGMKESEMKEIAELLKKIWIEREAPESVREKVIELRSDFQELAY